MSSSPDTFNNMVNNVLYSSVKLYRAYYRHVFSLCLLMAVISFITNFFMAGDDNPGHLIVLGFLLNVVLHFIQAIIIFYLNARINHYQLSVKQCFPISSQRFTNYFICYFVTLLPIGFMVVLGSSPTLMTNPMLTLLVIIIMLPILSLMVRAYFASFYALLRGDSIKKSFITSFALVRQQFWRAAGLLFFVLMISFCLSLLFHGAGLVLLKLFDAYFSQAFAQRILASSLLALKILLLTPFTSAMFLFVLHELARIKQPHGNNTDSDDMEMLA